MWYELGMAESDPGRPTRDVATRFVSCVGVGLLVWWLPTPAGMSWNGWAVLAVFTATIVSFLLRPLPMGAMVLIGLVVLSATGALDYKKEALTGFGDTTVWLVVAAFLIAGAVGRSGLGQRVALLMVRTFGRSTLGLGYAACAAELALGPFVPSNTARGGGVMAPIQNSLARALGSRPDHQPRRAGEFLMLVGAHANLIAAAMFLTGMAANPIVAQQAAAILDINFDWGTWALGAVVPGLVSLALLPLLIYRLAPPQLDDASAARRAAQEQLAALGTWTRREQLMSGVFLLLLALWTTKGTFHDMGSSLVAWIGVCTLLITRTDRWEDMARDHGAWDTLVWLGGLLSMAAALQTHGVITWFANGMRDAVTGIDGVLVALVLALIYFFSMYGFSMLTGHITAMAGAFFAVSLAAEAPPLLTVALIAYFSNLCGCLTNYSTGPVVIYFGLGYVPIGRWFRIGFLVALMHLAVWILIGGVWWKALGWW